MSTHNDVAMRDLEQKLRKIHAVNLKNGAYNDPVTLVLTTAFPWPRPQSLWERLRQFVETHLVSSTSVERAFAYSLGQPNHWLVMLQNGRLALHRPSHPGYQIVALYALSPDEFRKIAAEIEQWWIVYRRPIQPVEEYRPDTC